MRKKVKLERLTGGLFKVTLSPAQASIAENCIDLMFRELSTGIALEMLFNASRDRINKLCDDLRVISSGGRSKALEVDRADLLLLYGAVLTAFNEILTEEDFHIRVGWYKENAQAFARALTSALVGL